jgi:hypothetical protein
MTKQPVRPTRAMKAEDFAKHVNSRHLGKDGEIYPSHFDFVYGLETMWRGWHLQDHRKFPDELDHYHKEAGQ